MKCPGCAKTLLFSRVYCPFCRSHILTAPRPKAVSVIGWASLLLGGFLCLIMAGDSDMRTGPLHAKSPLLQAWIYAGPVAAFVCGTLILRGVNLARWVLIMWFGFNTARGLVMTLGRSAPTLQAGRVLAAVFVGACAYYLFRRDATAFFRPTPSLAVTPPVAASDQKQCAECGASFPESDMLIHGDLQICAACKPRFLQKLREGLVRQDTA